MLMSYAKRSVLVSNILAILTVCPRSPDGIKIKDDMWMEGDDFKRSMYDGSDYGPAAYKRNYKSPVSRFMKLAYQW